MAAIDKSFTVPQFEEFLTRCQEYTMEQTYKALAFLGEKCVNRVRDRSAEDSWIDHTGNLRSSIGYLITVNGKPMSRGGFKPTPSPEGSGGAGQSAGQSYAGTIASRFASSPIALVVVAGMEYAMFVEALDNKDVLAGAELWARDEWKRTWPGLKSKIERGWDKIAREMGME